MTIGRRSIGLTCLCLLALTAIAAPGTAAAAETCPNAKYRTGPSLFLPECRAYEMVTPPGKTNVLKLLVGPTNIAKVTEDGEKILYVTASGPLDGDPSSGIPALERAHRTPTGWQTERAAPPILAPFGETLTGVPRWVIPSSNLDKIFFSASGVYNANQVFTGRANFNGSVHLSDGVTDAWVSEPTWSGSLPADGTPEDIWTRFVPVGGSSDFGIVYLNTFATLTPEDATSGRPALQSMAVYKYENGQLSNAGVLPDGSISPGGSVSAERIGQGVQGSPNSADNDSTLDHPVSRDGKSLLFVSPDPVRAQADPSLPKPQLYMAIDGKPSILISAPEGVDEPIAGTAGVAATSNRMNGPATSAAFAVATPDHSVVLFSTKDALTAAAEGVGPEVFKTYRYETTTGALTYLPDLDRTRVAPTLVSEHGMVVELSESGNSMLYMTEGGLLRLWREGKPTLTVSEGMSESVTPGGSYITTAQFSDDEQVIALNSTGPLRGDPDHTPGTAVPIAWRSQVYRYTVADNGLECISCKPGGSLTGAVLSLWGPVNGYSSTGALPVGAWATRSMTGDGSTIYFTTATPLVEADHNTVDDVYQWHGGQLLLFSSGATGAFASTLLETTRNGRDVFIVSAERLSPSDTDELNDIYDVRVDGGIDPPQPPDAPCTADECQGSPTPAPGAPSMGSASVSGRGNAIAAPKPFRAHAPRRVKGTKVILRVQVPDAGRLVVNGHFVKKATRNVTKGGGYKVKVALTGSGTRKLRQVVSMRTGLRITFKPRTGVAMKRTLQVTFKQPARAANTGKGR
jgi:hypothetical protein